MTTPGNKSVLKRYLELMTRGPVDDLPSIVAENVTGYDGNERVSGLSAIMTHARDAQAGCPDLRIEIEQMIEDGEWVAFIGVTSGRQSGALFGMPASNREFRRARNGNGARPRWKDRRNSHWLGHPKFRPSTRRPHRFANVQPRTQLAKSSPRSTSPAGTAAGNPARPPSNPCPTY